MAARVYSQFKEHKITHSKGYVGKGGQGAMASGGPVVDTPTPWPGAGGKVGDSFKKPLFPRVKTSVKQDY